MNWKFDFSPETSATCCQYEVDSNFNVPSSEEKWGSRTHRERLLVDEVKGRIVVKFGRTSSWAL